MRILVLGHKGMLGHMVVKYLRNQNINVHTMDKRWPFNQQGIKTYNGDYIINCIAKTGTEPCETLSSEAIKINSLFPLNLVFLENF